MPLTPKNRKEEWLQGLVDHETTLTPKNRPEEWMKEIIDASGGGGGGGSNVMIVTLTYDDVADDGTYTSSATAAEIATANSEGKAIIGKSNYGQFFVTVLDILGMLSITGIVVVYTNNSLECKYLLMNTETNIWRRMN